MLNYIKSFKESCGKLVPFVPTKTENKEKVESKMEKSIESNPYKVKEYKSYKDYKSYKEEIVYKGVKNKTDFPEFVELCKLTQPQLKVTLVRELIKRGYEDVIEGDGYIYAKGTLPILLTAHMDTVHKETIVDFYEEITDDGEHIISSPQGIGGDDRCGCYMILEIVKEHKCSVIFCEDEEIGRVGAKKFVQTEFIEDLKQMKYLIELDRRGNDDAVFYQCDNEDFIKFIEENTGYKKAYGSYSDISTLAPACKVAAVNLSCGYYNAHQLSEKVNVEEMINTIDVVKMLLRVDCEQFEYVERKYTNYNYGKYDYSKYNYSKYDYGKYCDDDYDDYGYGCYGSSYGNESYDNWLRRYLDTYKKTETKDTVKAKDEEIVFEEYDYDYTHGYNRNENYEDYEDCYDSVTLTILYMNDDGNTEDFESYGSSEAEAWMNFFMENPEKCYANVLDYDCINC